MTTTRTFPQFVQLQQRLAERLKTVLVPVLPDGPNPAMIHEPTHVEKKRRQVERFLGRLAARDVFWTNPLLVAFLGPEPVRPPPFAVFICASAR